MINSLKKSLNILGNNTLFMQPVLLFLFLSLSILILFSGRNLYPHAKIILMVALILLFIAFSAGWFFIIKHGITSYNEDDTREEVVSKSVENLKKFFEGVGATFLRLTGVYIISFALYTLVIFLLSKFCLHCFGLPEIYDDIMKFENAASKAEQLNILNSIPIETLDILRKWVLVLYPASSVLNFFVILYCAVTYFEEANIFKCFISSIGFFFKNILGCIGIIIILQFIYVLINLLSAIIGANIIGLFIVTMIFTFYLNYFVILVFCYYNDKKKDNSNSGSELIGQDEAGDTNSEND